MTVKEAIGKLDRIREVAMFGHGCPGCKTIEALVEEFMKELEGLLTRRRKS